MIPPRLFQIMSQCSVFSLTDLSPGPLQPLPLLPTEPLGQPNLEGEDEGVAGVELGEEAGQEVLLLLHLEHAVLEDERPQLLHRAGRHVVRDAGGEDGGVKKTESCHNSGGRVGRPRVGGQRRLSTKVLNPISEKRGKSERLMQSPGRWKVLPVSADLAGVVCLILVSCRGEEESWGGRFLVLVTKIQVH